MSYQWIKLFVYIICIMMSMYGFSCFNYESFILKGKLKQFYLAFFVVTIAVGYLFASFILEFMTIHL